ncbi:hypothetical protein ACFL6M_07035 [Candidatus Eisenbacteria bacterium]|uniref:Uncharacterized protein n=1 Tax=Eiseniibacteriota bacterium TaxID=2212470 RepID=A0ABV6YLX3_UNCEI
MKGWICFRRVLIVYAAILTSLPGGPVGLPTGAAETFESYFRYLGEFPDDNNTIYDQSVQGLTHDSTNWFITQAAELWKIPVQYDLYLVQEDWQDVRHISPTLHCRDAVLES